MNLSGQFPPEKTICKWRWSYPVIHVSRSEVRTCDKPINIRLTEEDFQTLGTDAFLNNPYLMERRREKLHGSRHSDCFTCIKLEDRGMQSTRTGVEPFVRYVNDVMGVSGSFEDFTYSERPELLRADFPDILEISLSNLCNLKCVYCSPTFSTSWEDEAVRYGDMHENQREAASQVKPPSFDKYFWLWFSKIKTSLNSIVFIGGEPLLHDELFVYLTKIKDELQECKEKRAGRKLVVNIISNFNIPAARFDRFLSLLPQLTEDFIIRLEASGESVGARSEFIRSGQRWDLYLSNIKKVMALDLPNFTFGQQMAINALNVTSLKSLFELTHELQQQYGRMINFKENVVVAPEYLSPYVLTPDFAQHVDECIVFIERNLANPAFDFRDPVFGSRSSNRWSQYLPFLKSIKHGILTSEGSVDLRQQFALFVDRMEARRKVNFLEVFPEYAAFLKKCRELSSVHI